MRPGPRTSRDRVRSQRGRAGDALRVLLLFPLLIGAAAEELDVRPSDSRPAQPATERPDDAVPEIEVESQAGERTPDRRPLTITPTAFSVEGVTAFEPDELEAVLAPFVGRPLSSEDLDDPLEALRSLYQDAGYTTSVVQLPDQDLAEGILRIEVLEGRLDALELVGLEYHRPKPLEQRLRPALRAPVDVPELIRRLEILQSEPEIERIEATLVEVGPGRHRLRVVFEERTPWTFRVRSSNQRSPAVGSIGGRLQAGFANSLGRNDRLVLGAQFSQGVRDFQGSYSVPFTPWDTRLNVGWRRGHAEIVEHPFSDLSIEGRFESISLGLQQPVWRRRTSTIAIGVVAEWRKSTSTVFGRVECFQLGLQDCTPSTAVVRLVQEGVWRSPQRAVAGRMIWSFGVDALGATPERDAGNRDGEYFAWLGQVQGVTRIPPIGPWPWLDGMQMLVRADLQLSTDPLLSIEQIAVGGGRSVRGFRENQVVRDNGFILSAELQVPVWRTRLDRSLAELGLFVDHGSAWDRRRGQSPDRTLTSAGLALRVRPTETVRGELSWAHRFRDDLVKGDRLQRNGVYFEVAWDVF